MRARSGRRSGSRRHRGGAYSRRQCAALRCCHICTCRSKSSVRADEEAAFCGRLSGPLETRFQLFDGLCAKLNARYGAFRSTVCSSPAQSSSTKVPPPRSHVRLHTRTVDHVEPCPGSREVVLRGLGAGGGSSNEAASFSGAPRANPETSLGEEQRRVRTPAPAIIVLHRAQARRRGSIRRSVHKACQLRLRSSRPSQQKCSVQLHCSFVVPSL